MARSQPTSKYKFLMLVLTLVTGNASAMPCGVMKSADGSRVECSNHRLTRLPADLPDDVVWLDVSSNFLRSLDFLQDPRLHKLQHLFARYNSITSLSNGAFGAVLNLHTLDLSYNPLKTLPADMFRDLKNLTHLVLSTTGLHPDSVADLKNMNSLSSLDLSNNSLSSIPDLQNVSSLQHLDLSRNSLTTIPNHSLNALSNLEDLSLQFNQLTSLQSAAFDGLKKLITLDLSFNQLGFEFGYPAHVFTPLISLEVLRIKGNSREYEDYPEELFAPLHTLKTLSIDTFYHSEFRTAFTRLAALTTLFLDGSDGTCNLKQISNNTFSAFHHSTLETLNMEQCNLMRVDFCAFCHLPHLTNLVVTSTHGVKIRSLLLSLYGVQNQTLEEVNFLSTRHHGPTTLDGSVTLYLNNVCIKRLNLQSCDIDAISSTAFQFHGRFLKCLKHVDLSKNLMTYLTPSMYMKLFLGLTSLESLEFYTQRKFSRHCHAHYHLPSDPSRPHADVTLYVNTAPSLRYLNGSNGISDLDELPRYVSFTHGGNLSTVDLSYCGIQDCNFSVTGLTNIHTVDLSGNDCYVMGEKVFQHMPTLRRLMLSDVYLQEQFLFTSGSAMLQPLEDLEELDLSSNHLGKLPADLLKHQTRLKRVVLAGNRFENVPLDLSLLTDLEELDLSGNMIHILPRSHQLALDTLAANHTVTLRLRGNPLSCTCQALDMVSWLHVTTVRLDGDNRNEAFDEDYDDNGRDFPCVLEDGRMSSTWAVMLEWESHWRACVGLPLFTVAVVAQLVQLLGLVMTYVMWSNWTYVKYVWHVLRHVRLPRRSDFVHDVLLVHASDDLQTAVRMKRIMLRVMPALRLALLEDDVPLGSFTPDFIPSCIERSWKILLLVTEEFLLDDLSGYTVLHAQASLSDTMPRRVLILYVQDLRPQDTDGPTHLSMRRLLRMLPENNVYHVPGDVTGRPDHPVWISLTQAVVDE